MLAIAGWRASQQYPTAMASIAATAIAGHMKRLGDEAMETIGAMGVSEIEGQHIGEYRLLRQIGEGSFSKVYLGASASLDKPVAIKILPKHTVKSDIEKFLIQAKILTQLEHPHIVRVYDSGIASGTPYLIMSYAPHGTLRQRHPKGTRLPLSKALSYVKQVAEALQYVHDRQMVHRDVKP